jgi:hypothetical protein
MGGDPVDDLSVNFDWQTPSTVGIAESVWTAKWQGLPKAWHVHYTADFVTKAPVIESNLTGDVTVDGFVQPNLWNHVTGSVTWTPTSAGCSGSVTGTGFALDTESYINFPYYPEEEVNFSFVPRTWSGSAQCLIDGVAYPEYPPNDVFDGSTTAQNYQTISGGQTQNEIPYTETDHWQFTGVG